jgi:uncharacterized membrane protein
MVFLFILVACGGEGGGGNGNNAPTPTVSSLNFDIKTLTGFFEGAFGASVAVNELGQSVGVADNGLTLKAVKWDATAVVPTPTLLGGLAGGGEYSAAYAINDDNVIVGEASDGVRPVAVFWAAGSTAASPLPATGLFADGTSAAYGINGKAQIIGEADVDLKGKTVAIYWSGPAASPVVLKNLSVHPDAYSAAYDISEFGVIIGESLTKDGHKVPVAWVPDPNGGFGDPVALPLLSGHVEGVALNLNDADEIVGESIDVDGTVYGVIWALNPAGAVMTIHDLGPNTSLNSINNNQLAGGYINSGNGSFSANIWSSTDVTDTKELTESFSQAYGLNDSNWAVGTANGAGFVAIPQ